MLYHLIVKNSVQLREITCNHHIDKELYEQELMMLYIHIELSIDVHLSRNHLEIVGIWRDNLFEYD